MKSFIRSYSIASLAVILLAAVAIVVMYRAIVIRGITAIAETSSVATARIALHPIRTYLADYLEVASVAGRDPKSVAMPEALQDAIAELMRDSQVARIKIYNDRGVVLFSTNPKQIGKTQASNPGVVAAMSGKVSVKLVYADTFNPFDNATEDDNLVQSYFPVRMRPTDPVVGVFEMYTDVNALVIEAERSVLQLIIATALILACMYTVLLLLVYRLHELIEDQQRTIREKNALLVQLSRESLRREESERKKFATDLHEGLAQTLSAVKFAMENARGSSSPGRGEALESVIPDLQSAIGQARTIAMDLRPPSLDALGLGPTIDALCREFEGANPDVQVERQIAAQESAIPAPLKIIVYRILETALKIVGSHPEATEVRIALETSNRALTLVIEDNATAVVTAMRDEDGGLDPHSPFGAVRERVIISGGKLSIVSNASGNPVLRASWLL